MPRLICFACGRAVWATVPLDQLFAEERRCPRCGASLRNDRRMTDRRYFDRRSGAGEPPGGVERRVGDRRTSQRRNPEQ